VVSYVIRNSKAARYSLTPFVYLTPPNVVLLQTALPDNSTAVLEHYTLK